MRLLKQEQTVFLPRSANFFSLVQLGFSLCTRYLLEVKVVHFSFYWARAQQESEVPAQVCCR